MKTDEPWADFIGFYVWFTSLFDIAVYLVILFKCEFGDFGNFLNVTQSYMAFGN